MHKAIQNALRPTTRREAIKTGTAFAAVAAVGLPAIAQANAPDPLEALEAEWREARTRTQALMDDLDDMRSKHLRKPSIEWVDHKGKKTILEGSEAVRGYAAGIAQRIETFAPDSELKAAIDAFNNRLLTECDRQEAEIKVERDTSGHTALLDEFEQASIHQDQIETAIFDTPAQSMRGVAVKLRMQGVYECAEWAEKVNKSALADIERLTA